MGLDKVALVFGGLVALAGLVVGLWPLARRSFIYPGGQLAPAMADPARHGLEGAEEVWLEPEDGLRIHAWWTPARRPTGDGPPTRGAVLYCHGNAETMATRAWIADRLADRGFDVLLFDYRGYGLSDGRATEAGVYADARAAWRYVVEERGHDPSRVVIMGHSLGSAVAGRLALEVSGAMEPPGVETAPAGVVLGSPFPDMMAVFKANAPWLPGFALRWKRERLDAGSRLAELDAPLLVVVGTRDQLIPADVSEPVYRAAAEPKRLVTAPAVHGELMGHPAVWEALDRFLDEVAGR